jgi:hypothetical protein
MPSYRQHIDLAIAPLLRQGFVVRSSVEELKHFGDSEVILEGEALRLRFLSDRGRFFVDVGLLGNDSWYDLSEVLTRLRLRGEPGRWESPADAVEALTRSGSEIASRLLDDNFVRDLVTR